MGFWRAPAFAGERIPTLRELLALAEESGIRVKIDNVWQSFPEAAQQTLFRELRESRAAVGMTCNSPETLRLVTRELPGGGAALRRRRPFAGAGLQTSNGLPPGGG